LPLDFVLVCATVGVKSWEWGLLLDPVAALPSSRMCSVPMQLWLSILASS
jgi:hypothetical protein